MIHHATIICEMVVKQNPFFLNDCKKIVAGTDQVKTFAVSFIDILTVDLSLVGKKLIKKQFASWVLSPDLQSNQNATLVNDGQQIQGCSPCLVYYVSDVF